MERIALLPSSDGVGGRGGRASQSFSSTWGWVRFVPVKTTPQMTRFRDAKVCNNLATDEIDDSDYNKNCNIQKERTLHLVLRMRGEDSRHQ